MPINSFMVFAQMVETNNPKLRLAPLGNILTMTKVKAGCKITFGCEANVMDDVFAERVVGGFIIADKEEVKRVRASMDKESPAERIAALEAQLAEAQTKIKRLIDAGDLMKTRLIENDPICSDDEDTHCGEAGCDYCAGIVAFETARESEGK